MEVTALTKDAYHALLRRLQGSGYTSEPSSVRDQELGAVARIAEMAAEGLVRASRNFFVGSADDALDAYERVRFLVGSAGLATSRRQARLLAFVRGMPLVEARLRNAFAAYLADTTGETVRATEANLIAHQACPIAALVVGDIESEADKHAALDLDPVLARGLPCRALSGHVAVPVDGSAALLYGATLDDSPRAIATVPVVTVPAQTKARSAPIAFHPGAVVTRAMWLELQAMLLWKSRGFSLDQNAQGRTYLLVAEIGAAATEVIDIDISWAHRFVSASGSATVTADADLTALTAAEHVWLPPSKLGAAGAGLTQSLVTLSGISAGLTVHVNAGGNLVVTNGGATRDVVLMLRGSPVYTEGSSTDTQPWADANIIDGDQLGELYAATIVTDDGPLSFAGADAGAIRRIVYTGGLTRETGDGAVRSVILDASEDYRERYVLVVPLTLPVATGVESAYYPHAGADGLAPRSLLVEAPRLFYTGAGAAAGDDAVLGLQHPDRLDTPDVWLFSDADGNLCAEMKTVSAHKSACLLALIIATEKTDGSSVVTAVPVDTDEAQTIDLEQPQNCGVFAQGFQGGVPRYDASSPEARAVPTCPPLGLIHEGHAPPRPVSWLVRERLGLIEDGTYEVRQPIVGQRKRLVSMVVDAETLVPIDDFNVAAELAPGVNDQLDFRDRFVWIEGRYSAGDILVESDPGADDDAATPFFAAFYTGPYADVEVALTETLSVVFEFSKSGTECGYHSRLCLRNTDVADVYVNASIECSGFLGLSDLRQYGVIGAFEYASGDEFESSETAGYADDYGIEGGPYVA
jgi:hypothetical protein